MRLASHSFLCSLSLAPGMVTGLLRVLASTELVLYEGGAASWLARMLWEAGVAGEGDLFSWVEVGSLLSFLPLCLNFL